MAKLDSRIGALLSLHLRLLKIWTRTWTEGFVFPLVDNEVELSTKLVSDAARDGRDYGSPMNDCLSKTSVSKKANDNQDETWSCTNQIWRTYSASGVEARA